MKKKTAVVPANAKPLALPDSPFPIPKPGEDSENAAYLARVEKWYTNYFIGMPLTFTRADVGKAISPGDWYMRMCIKLLACNVIFVPREDRHKFYAPLKFVLRAIAQTWDECAAHALSAVDHIEELQRLFDVDEKEQIQEDDLKREVAKVDAERDGLKDDLRKLSETLLNANAARADEMLAAIEDVRGRVDAANVKLAAVGEDAKAARDAAERAAAELAGWRDWLKEIRKGKHPRTPPLCRPMADAVCKAWNDYESGTADCEVPKRISKDGYRKARRSYRECLETHGADIVYHSNANGRGYTLSELAPDVAAFRRIVNAGRMRENRQPTPPQKRKNAQAAHKRARK